MKLLNVELDLRIRKACNNHRKKKGIEPIEIKLGIDEFKIFCEDRDSLWHRTWYGIPVKQFRGKGIRLVAKKERCPCCGQLTSKRLNRWSIPPNITTQ